MVVSHFDTLFAFTSELRSLILRSLAQEGPTDPFPDFPLMFDSFPAPHTNAKNPLSARDRPPFRAVGRVRTGPAETETPPKCAAHRGNCFYVSLMVCTTQRPGQKWGVWKIYYLYCLIFLPRPGAPHFGPLLSLPFRPYQVCRLHIFAHFCSVFAHFPLVERGRVSTLATFPERISRPGPRAGIRPAGPNFLEGTPR